MIANSQFGLRARTLNEHLFRTRRILSRLNRTGGESIRKNESDLFQVHADAPPERAFRLLDEMALATGAKTQDEIIQSNRLNNINSFANNTNNNLFSLSQRQIWSVFAREISKSIKRNL